MEFQFPNLVVLGFDISLVFVYQDLAIADPFLVLALHLICDFFDPSFITRLLLFQSGLLLFFELGLCFLR